MSQFVAPLSTPRLQLREMVQADVHALQRYGRDPDFRRYEDVADMDDASFNDIMQDILAERWRNPRYSFYFAITPAHAPDVTLGSIYVAIRHQAHRQGEIGYVLGREHWGKGYATESALAVLNFGFHVLDLHRIYAECNGENHASQRVLKRIGMRQEGHLHQTQYFSGRWWDTLIFAMLKHDFPTPT